MDLYEVDLIKIVYEMQIILIQNLGRLPYQEELINENS